MNPSTYGPLDLPDPFLPLPSCADHRSYCDGARGDGYYTVTIFVTTPIAILTMVIAVVWSVEMTSILWFVMSV